MQNDIDAVEEYAKRRHKSERWVAKESEKIRKEYAGKIKAAAIAEAIVNSALAIIRVYKDLPIWAAIPVSAIVAAATGIQIATIKAQKMAEGGIVPPGYPNDSYPALLTSGEKVLPAKPLPLGMSKVQVSGRFVVEGTDLVAIIEKQMSIDENY